MTGVSVNFWEPSPARITADWHGRTQALFFLVNLREPPPQISALRIFSPWDSTRRTNRCNRADLRQAIPVSRAGAPQGCIYTLGQFSEDACFWQV